MRATAALQPCGGAAMTFTQCDINGVIPMSWKEKAADMRSQLRSLNGCVPEMAKGFNALSKAAKAPSALDEKTVEFIALGIAVAERCEPCIVFHMEALVRLGATRAEIGDALAMIVQMGGGPSLMYAANAVAAFDEFSKVVAAKTA